MYSWGGLLNYVSYRGYTFHFFIVHRDFCIEWTRCLYFSLGKIFALHQILDPLPNHTLYRVGLGGWYRVGVGGWYRVRLGGWYRVGIGGWYRVGVGG